MKQIVTMNNIPFKTSMFYILRQFNISEVIEIYYCRIKMTYTIEQIILFTVI